MSGCVRIRVDGTLTTSRSALGNAEEVSDDTDELFARYARSKSAVNVSYSISPGHVQRPAWRLKAESGLV